MKIINVPVGFPDDFSPPDKFDGTEDCGSTGKCCPCPFYSHDVYEPYEGCALSHMVKDNECPIMPLFEKS